MNDKNLNFDDLIWNRPSLPDKVTPDEDIILVARQDAIIPILRAVGLYLVFFVLLIFRVIVLGFANALTISMYDIGMYGIGALLLTYFIIIYHNFYLSIQIVTTERIIDIDQKGLFSREINTLPIQNIEDISYKLSGFWGTIFNFGNVIIQTAGTGANSVNPPNLEDTINGFTFNNVAHPKKVAAKLSEVFYLDETRDRKDDAQAHAAAIKEAMRELKNEEISNNQS